MTRMQEVHAYMRALESEPDHVLQVERLALSLYDQLRFHCALAAFPEVCRERLAAAALLHDIGWSISPGGSGHHKASAQLISEHAWIGWNPGEVKLVAQIARYHRKALPALDHEEFRLLDEGGRAEVCALGAILRIADALDRRHVARTMEVRVEIAEESLRLALVPAMEGDVLEAERAAAVKKSDLAERVFGCRFAFTVC